MRGVRHATLASGAAALLVAGPSGPPGGATAPVVTPIEQVSWDAEDLVNPGRGQYRWGGTSRWRPMSDMAPQLFSGEGSRNRLAGAPWPGTTLRYHRFSWAELEPEEGIYRFDRIDRMLAGAAGRGEKFSFRVTTLSTCCGVVENGINRAYPAWLDAKMENRFDYLETNPDGTTERIFVPDWNDEQYLAGFAELLNALGARYDLDERLGSVDISGYGNYGEWHVHRLDDPETAEDESRTRLITDANARQLVDANVTAFPNTRLNSLTAQTAALEHALGTPRVGLRVDCLGDPAGGSAFEKIVATTRGSTRWQTQPFITEWCNGILRTSDVTLQDPGEECLAQQVGKDEYLIGRNQVRLFHVSLLSSGNFPHAHNGKRMHTSQYRNWVMANKTSGYRYSITYVTAPDTVARGATIPLTTKWQNAGVAPTYDAWAVEYQLRPRGSTHVTTSVESGIDLTTLYSIKVLACEDRALPAVATRSDSATITAPRVAGIYELMVKVSYQVQKPGSRTSTRVYTALPMRLAQMNRTHDGAYLLATITVR